jgi:RHH-type proline utilization regulon transcriptional repressor/proline dehydrogenase/delta 1-pyrroline-5-carboxylate dehydrogenase
MPESKPLQKALKPLLANTFADEQTLINSYSDNLHTYAYAPKTVERTAITLVNIMRNRKDNSLFDAFMREYGLDTEEGLAMMRLSEALLRIPDNKTANALIQDLIKGVDWLKHVSTKNTRLIRFSSTGMAVAKRLFAMGDLASTPANPVIRRLLKLGVYQLGDHFICGSTIDRALQNSKKQLKEGFLFSYDMLGESARTDAQAEHYQEAYLSAISAVSLSGGSTTPLEEKSGISVKLSALYTHCEYTKKERVFKRLLPRLKTIAMAGKEANIPITIDAEEAHRLDLSLDLLTALYQDEDLAGYHGLGLAVQAYQKRALSVIDYVVALATETDHKIPIRLVKGAYWDTEIKLAQEQGLADYPVFTRKSHTDISYLTCMYRMFEAGDAIYPQFATHNAHSAAAVIEAAKGRPFEFQFLYGMGAGLYDSLVNRYPCRIYAPVGDYIELLAYLIRRLLENGANTSFVNHLLDHSIPAESICTDPLKRSKQAAAREIPKPDTIFLPMRKNSRGIAPNYRIEYDSLSKNLAEYHDKRWQGYSLISGSSKKEEASQSAFSPFDQRTHIGEVYSCQISDVEHAVQAAKKAFNDHWQYAKAEDRACIIDTFAALLESHKPELISLCMQEAGKTLQDSIDEVREAVDFCYYYANQAREKCSTPVNLPAPTGEKNQLTYHGRGVFVCISPWNFPLAIFIGQITAALAAGNAVVAKPARQTPMIATRAIELLLEAGMPADVIQLVVGSGKVIGQALIQSKDIAGIAFTGSTQTANKIQKSRAEIEGALIPLIAETGGVNAMIVDSSILLEQTVDAIIRSAFDSAGQRCSALRVLFVDQAIEDPLLDMLSGAMQELRVDSPMDFSTDTGSVIDARAKESLLTHIQRMTAEHQLVAKTPLSEENTAKGHFVAPHCFKIKQLTDINGEHFGPILHVISYHSDKLNQIVDQINNSGYGLTLGIQTRILSKAEAIRKRAHVGNSYINRTMTGAVVGVHPFGGEGLSGTGPKAGGPNYLNAFMRERVNSHDTTAIGGNRDLLVL